MAVLRKGAEGRGSEVDIAPAEHLDVCGSGHIIDRMVPHISFHALLRSLRPMLVALLLVLALVAGIGGAVVAQAGREETPRADGAVVLLDGAEDGEAARLDHTLRLYLGGQLSRIVLAGSDPGPARDVLLSRGVVQDKLIEVREPTQIAQLDGSRRVLQELRVVDVMLISEPVETLRLLKIARDQGFAIRSAPRGATGTISLRDVVDEIGRYLVYCFFGR